MNRKKGVSEKQTIQNQILKGYLALIGVIVVLVAAAILFLEITDKGYRKVTQYQEQQKAIQEVVTAHYQWLEQLSQAVTMDVNFTGGLDPDNCALGKWISSAGVDMAQYPEIQAQLNQITTPHREIHQKAQELIALSQTDKPAAIQNYKDEFQPKVELIGSGLSQIIAQYSEISDEVLSRTKLSTLISYVLLVLLGAASVVLSIWFGKRVSARISKPVLSVAEWSEQLSTGVDNLHFDDQTIRDRYDTLEISRMINAFKDMAESIRNNVSIIQKIADGDLTAYVDIKSSGDSLGKNLYHLVQNNDFMFANLLQVADSVASNAENIATASQELAQSSIKQAAAVENLSATVDRANELAINNAIHSTDASKIIEDMRQDVLMGKEKLSSLLNAVMDIQNASSNISNVLKSINDIATQTNLLALNASVEAARAGVAGKGFAVVADEVRNLAKKSAEAADESRKFIEDTIHKANEGNKISKEAYDTFATIVEISSKVSEVMTGISEASNRQQAYMEEIHEEIGKISTVVVANAAASEETAAATQQMNANADIIKREMKKFNLRKREAGKPYIPPEKANDEEFIRLATLNYQKKK